MTSNLPSYKKAKAGKSRKQFSFPSYSPTLAKSEKQRNSEYNSIRTGFFLDLAYPAIKTNVNGYKTFSFVLKSFEI